MSATLREEYKSAPIVQVHLGIVGILTDLYHIRALSYKNV